MFPPVVRTWTRTLARTIYLRGRYRLGSFKVPAQYKGLFPRILAGSNPGGIGHHWVKETSVDRGQYNLCKVVNDEGGMLRQFIPTKMQDNPR